MNTITITLPKDLAEDIIAKVGKRRKALQARGAQQARQQGAEPQLIDAKLPDADFIAEQIRTSILADYIAQERDEAARAAGTAKANELTEKLTGGKSKK